MFLREELKNKNTIINILLENIFFKNNVEKNQFETLKRYSLKNSDKTLDNETILTILSDSDESDKKQI